ncbi:MAG: hypothetical protein ACXU95_17000, partial [Isosphaeraceae bacterium]
MVAWSPGGSFWILILAVIVARILAVVLAVIVTVIMAGVVTDLQRRKYCHNSTRFFPLVECTGVMILSLK